MRYLRLQEVILLILFSFNGAQLKSLISTLDQIRVDTHSVVSASISFQCNLWEIPFLCMQRNTIKIILFDCAYS